MKKFIFQILSAIINKFNKRYSRKGLYPFLHNELAKIPEKSSVLNIGSGGEVGDVVDEYSRRNNFSVTSFDYDSEKQPDIIGDVCRYQFHGEKFDFILLIEVLEHLYDPQSALQNIYSALKVKGTLILTTPFLFPIHSAPNDYYRFTKYGLAYLLRDYKDVVIKERNSYFDAINVLWLRLWTDKNRVSKILYIILFPVIAVIKLPCAFVLNSINHANYLGTTGYLVTGSK